MGREIIETYSRSRDEGIAAPSSGEFQLAGRLLCDVIDQIDSIVKLVGDYRITRRRIGNGLRIKLPQRCNLTDGTLEIGLAEEVSRPGIDLTADDLLIGQVIAVDHDIIQGGRLTFGNTHLNIDRVILDIDLYRGKVEEEVSAVTVCLGDIVFILLAAAEETLIHRNDIVHITLLNLENLIKGVRRINGITCP